VGLESTSPKALKKYGGTKKKEPKPKKCFSFRSHSVPTQQTRKKYVLNNVLNMKNTKKTTIPGHGQQTHDSFSHHKTTGFFYS